jgi:hypothetical protein
MVYCFVNVVFPKGLLIEVSLKMQVYTMLRKKLHGIGNQQISNL